MALYGTVPPFLDPGIPIDMLITNSHHPHFDDLTNPSGQMIIMTKSKTQWDIRVCLHSVGAPRAIGGSKWSYQIMSFHGSIHRLDG
jgi:hypothetical protein